RRSTGGRRVRALRGVGRAGEARGQAPRSGPEHGRGRRVSDLQLPEWMAPVVAGIATITVDELTRFAPPPGTDARRGAVLMLFAESEAGEPELLFTERAH